MLKKKIRAYASHPIRGKKGKEALPETMEANNRKAIRWGKKLWVHFGSDLVMYIPGASGRWAEIGMAKGYLTIDQILDIDCEIVAESDVVLVFDWEGISGGMAREIDKAKELGIPYRVITDVKEDDLKALKIWLEQL